MASKKISRWLLLFLLGWAVVIWVWVLVPQPVETKDFIFPAIDSPFLVSEDGSPFSFREGEIVATLSYPKTIHTSESGKGELRVSYIRDEFNTDTDASYHLIVESRLDLPLLKVSPESGIEQTFEGTRPLNFQWKIISKDSGKYEGQLWVYILIVNREGEIDRQAMLAAPIELESHNFLGFSEPILVWAGGILVPVLLGIFLHYRKIE
jgi:hypothetical protein